MSCFASEKVFSSSKKHSRQSFRTTNVIYRRWSPTSLAQRRPAPKARFECLHEANLGSKRLWPEMEKTHFHTGFLPLRSALLYEKADIVDKKSFRLLKKALVKENLNQKMALGHSLSAQNLNKTFWPKKLSHFLLLVVIVCQQVSSFSDPSSKKSAAPSDDNFRTSCFPTTMKRFIRSKQRHREIKTDWKEKKARIFFNLN